MKRVTLLLAILLLPSVGYGGNGNDLLQSCSDAVKSYDAIAVGNEKAILPTFGAGYCQGLVTGAIKASSLIGAVAESNGFTKHPLWCLPDGVTIDQAGRVVVKYLHEHPEDLHKEDTMLIMIALGVAFPCK